MLRTLALSIAVLAAGCQERSKLDPPSTAARSGPAPGAPAKPGAVAAAGELSGTVVETMDSGGYTYARIERDGTSTWIAGPQTKLAVGTKLAHLEGSAMPNFHSDTLNRTFEQIYFVNALEIEGGATAARPPAQAQAQADAGDDLSGVVVETMNAGGYTYAQLDRAGTKIWVAGPETALAVGSQLGKMTGTLMPSFRSETLKRTFDKIYFVNAYQIASNAIPNPHSKPPATAATAPATAAAAAGSSEKIAPAPGGTTVADVFARKDALAGKPVTVRGKIVKINNGILGRNWLHLRDGTGAAATSDLLVTTDATAKVGDIVVVRGTVATHQDFGAGYAYEVIVEKAALASE